MLENNKKTRVIFECSNGTLPRPSSSSCVPVKHKQIAGVFNPHNLQTSKIANNSMININCSRGLGLVRLDLLSSTMGIISPNFTCMGKPQIQNSETLDFIHGDFCFTA